MKVQHVTGRKSPEVELSYGTNPHPPKCITHVKKKDMNPLIILLALSETLVRRGSRSRSFLSLLSLEDQIPGLETNYC